MLITGKVIALALAVLLSNYLINQISPLPEFPGKTGRLIRIIFYLMLIAVADQLIRADVGSSIRVACQYIGVASGGAVLYESFLLWRRVRRLPASNPDIEPNELLNRLYVDVKTHVKERLAYSVGDKSLINVVWKSHNEMIGRNNLQPILPQRNWLLRLLPLGKGKIDVGENILSVFSHEDVSRKLLIIGGPGSGKTTLLLKLAEALVSQFKVTQKVPYIFDLSSWRDDQQPILEWLSEQLKFEHGIDPKVSREWIRHNQLVPLLDGLDELGMTRQKKCMEKINEFSTLTGQEVVVCCRSTEYIDSELTLSALRAALWLQPLDQQQIKQYLKRCGRADAWREICQSPELLESLNEPDKGQDSERPEISFLRIPLFLQMLVVANLQSKQITNKTDLLEAYVEHQLRLDTRQQYRRWIRNKDEELKWAYKDVEREPDIKQTKHYLSWLARKLKENNTPNSFLIEDMQPQWLKSKSQELMFECVVIFLITTILGTSAGWALGLYISQVVGVTLGLIIGLSVCLILSLILGIVIATAFVLFNLNNNSRSTNDHRIEPVERYQFHFSREAREKLFKTIKLWLFGTTLFYLLSVILGVERYGFILGLTYFLTIGIRHVVTVSFQTEFKTREVPNQGILASYKSFLWVSLLAFPSSFLLLVVPRYVLYQDFVWQINIFRSIPFALFFGFMKGGGLPVLEHVILRFFLYRQGNIPYNYARFLKYTTERRLTQQVGGRFRFIHRELSDYFSEIGE